MVSPEISGGANQIPDWVSDALRCVVCGHRPIVREGAPLRCLRCGGSFAMSDGVLSLLPERMSDNNTRESLARMDSSVWHVISSPFRRSASVRRVYCEHARLIRKFAVDMYEDASILYLFSGDGLEAHLSGILNRKTVLSDISKEALCHAQQRVRSYRLPQPAAYVQCDAEHLPFDDRSYDIVIAFKGIHHCLVPQAAMAEVWRVARKRAVIFDNWQCLLTDVLYKINLSSRIEYSGLKPNRFNRICLQTMLCNAQIGNYYMETTLPYLIDRYVGWRGRKALQSVAKRLGQGNGFVLIVDREGTNLAELARRPADAYEANPTDFVPSEEQPVIPL